MTHRKINNILSVLIVILGLYIFISPLIPQIKFWFRDKSPEASAPYSGVLADIVGSDSALPFPTENRIVIPTIGLNEPVVEGSNIGVINQGGTWRRPNTAIPTEVNNTVIVGHRFFGSNSSTFYNLDKVSVGDKLAIYWEGQEIVYEVTQTKVVEASEVEIEGPSTERKLTLYTCTPIWTAENRLVVIAKPLNSQNEERGLENEEI